MNKSTIRNIYVVDDDIPSFQLIKELFADQPVRVRHFMDGSDLTGTLEKGEFPDLFVMDIQLPDTDGIVLTRKIKAVRPGIPVIAYTSYAMPGDREHFIQSGCDAYISKPIDVCKFLSIAGEFLPDLDL